MEKLSTKNINANCSGFERFLQKCITKLSTLAPSKKKYARGNKITVKPWLLDKVKSSEKNNNSGEECSWKFNNSIISGSTPPCWSLSSNIQRSWKSEIIQALLLIDCWFNFCGMSVEDVFWKKNCKIYLMKSYSIYRPSSQNIKRKLRYIWKLYVIFLMTA